MNNRILRSTTTRRARSSEVGIEREKWTHEDHLVNFRITWLLAIQSVLFGGYGYLLNMMVTQTDLASPDALQIAKTLLSLIPWFGFSFAAVSFFGIFAALIAMFLMKAQHGFRVSDFSRHRGPDVHMWTTIAGWSSAGLLPFVFGAAWLLTPSHVGQVSGSKTEPAVAVAPGHKASPSAPAASR